jgi:hypothetical protein
MSEFVIGGIVLGGLFLAGVAYAAGLWGGKRD